MSNESDIQRKCSEESRYREVVEGGAVTLGFMSPFSYREMAGCSANQK
jgi:hypothetical protein